jgi:hypothetical protein
MKGRGPHPLPWGKPWMTRVCTLWQYFQKQGRACMEMRAKPRGPTLEESPTKKIQEENEAYIN